jgi:DNA-binding response OmpR family regulator
MAIHGEYPHERPETRHVRFKKILVVDRDGDWGLPVRETLAASPYLTRHVADIGEGACSIGRSEPDLVVISSLVGDHSLQMLLRELESLATPPPVLLLAYLHGESRWSPWRSLPCISILRTPFTMHDVLEGVRALIGEPWEDSKGEGPSPAV